MKHLIEHFQDAVQTEEDVELLKKKILDLAVRGQLVEQDPNDEPAFVLLERIKEEKEQLMKEKKIRKTKALPEITDEEIPYEVPDNWVWLRLKDICYNFGQKKPDREFTYIDVSSINNDKGILNNEDNVLTPDKAPSRARKIVQKKSVLYSTVRPYLLNIAIVDRDFEYEPIVSTAFAVMHPFNHVNEKYLFYYLRSNVFINYVTKQMVGMAYPAINDNKLFKGLIPIAPLNEQKRIVDKVDELFTYCDQLVSDIRQEKEQSSSLNKNVFTRIQSPSNDNVDQGIRFIIEHMDDLLQTKEDVQLLRNSILSLATRGKLVEQDPNDEPASVLLERIKEEKKQMIKEKKIRKAKALPEITDEEIQFVVPKNWIWVRLDEISIYIQRGKSPKYTQIDDKYPVISQKCIQWDGFDISKARFIEPETIDSYQQERFLQNGDLLWNSTGTGTIGRINIFKNISKYKQVVADSHVTVIRPNMDNINPGYILYWIMSPFVQNKIDELASGTTKQVELNTTTVKKQLVPLPPLNEQKRIVDKVDELFAYCDQLEHQIDICDKSNNQFMQSALQEI